MTRLVTMKSISQTLIPILAVLIPTLAYAVVTVRDPVSVSQPLSGTTVIIIFEGEPKEAETDDDGILFWLLGDDKEPIESLPAGTIVKLGDGTELIWETTEVSWWSPVKIGIAVVAGGLIIKEATDGGGGGSSAPSEPVPPTDTTPPPTTPDAAVLACTVDGSSDAFTITREVAGSCEFASVVTVANTVESGGSDLTFTANVGTGFSVSPAEGTLAPGATQNVEVQPMCSPDEPGTVTGSLQISDTESGEGTCPDIELSVTTNEPVTETPPEPGLFFNSGPLTFKLEHIVGSSPCPDNFGLMEFGNSGGSPITVRVDLPVEWMGFEIFVQNPGNIFETTLAPGESVNLGVLFPCEGFVTGTQTATVTVISSDSEDSSVDTGGATYTFELTVN